MATAKFINISKEEVEQVALFFEYPFTEGRRFGYSTDSLWISEEKNEVRVKFIKVSGCSRMLMSFIGKMAEAGQTTLYSYVG